MAFEAAADLLEEALGWIRISGTPVPGSPNSLASRSGGLPATTVQTFQYDAAGRLTQEERTGVASTCWTYDAAGNRTGQYTGPQSITYTYGDDNRLLSQTNGSAVTTFSYDANGSMTGRSGPGETYAYSWDTAGRLSSIVRNRATQIDGPLPMDRYAQTEVVGRRAEITAPHPAAHLWRARRPDEEESPLRPA